MKKKLLCLLGLAALTLGLGACGNKGGEGGDGGNTPVEPAKQTFTVIFEVDGARYATARVKDGEKVTDEIGTPAKSGYTFVGWYEGETLVDLSTYVVTKNVTLTAKFEEVDIPELSVDDVKEADKTYYLVMGWWECEDPDDPTKKTSHLTRDTVRLFYSNLINYLKAVGATDANIEAISFRNYSTAAVADMGALVNADADVDILIGVGNNINSTAGVSLHDNSNDYKFQTKMGDPLTDRYVACTSYASELGVATYDWLKGTQAGKDAFTKVLTQAEIDASLIPETIDLTVTVHGDTDVVTHLTDKTTAITMPEITVADDKIFKGFALTATGEVVLDVNKDATLKYDDLKDLVAENANTLDLYPILEDKPVVTEDLVVYVHVQNNYLEDYEAKLLEARFKTTLTTENVKFNFINGNKDAFIAGVGDDADVLIGANNSAGTFTPDETGPVATAGAKHFANTSRKVVIRDSVAATHKTLAKKLYDFVVAEAIEYEVHATFWPKSDNSWVTVEERAAVLAGMTTQLNTYLNITGEETLLSKYNVKFTDVDVSVSGNKVADLGTATRALRDGKGTDLIIGCGGNVDSDTGAGMTIVEKKDIPTTMVAAGRKVALVVENPLAREIYDNYFVVAQA